MAPTREEEEDPSNEERMDWFTDTVHSYALLALDAILVESVEYYGWAIAGRWSSSSCFCR